MILKSIIFNVRFVKKRGKNFNHILQNNFTDFTIGD